MERTALVAIAGALLLAAGARAGTIVVETTGDPAPAGLCGLRDAIAAANADAPTGDCPAGSGADVIDLGGLEGLALVGGALPATELPALASAITVRGPGADRLTLAGNGVRLFLVDTFEGVVLEGLTLQDGDAATSAFEPGFGGCVLAWGPVTIRDSRLTGCSGRGALYVISGLARLERVLLDFNRGEGISVGGITGAGAIVIENTTVTGNGGYGLELVNADGPGPNASVYASTFVENGGANLYVPTYSGDPADFPLRLDHVLLASGEPNVNCAGQPVDSLGTNLANDDTCALDGPDDLPATPASIGPLADNGGPTATHAPFEYSAAVDSGASACPGAGADLLTDQRGAPRPRDGNGDGDARCDRGAVELPEPAGSGALAAALALAGLAGARRRRAGTVAAIALAAATAAVAPAAAEPLSNTALYGTTLQQEFPVEPTVWAEREGYGNGTDFAVTTRVWRGQEGSAAGGLYLYEYRLFRSTIFESLNGWTAPLRGLTAYDLDGDAQDDTSAWCADCPAPATGPIGSERNGDAITFSFFNGVEAQSAPLYLVSSHPPVPGEGTLETTLGPFAATSLVGAAGTATNTDATQAQVLVHFAINGPGLVDIVDGSAAGVHVNTRVWAGNAGTAAEGLYLYDYWIENANPPAPIPIDAFVVPSVVAPFDLDGDGVPDTSGSCNTCTGGATPPSQADQAGGETAFAFASGIPSFSSNLYVVSPEPPGQIQARVLFQGGGEASLTSLPEPGAAGGAAALVALCALRRARALSPVGGTCAAPPAPRAPPPSRRRPRPRPARGRA